MSANRRSKANPPAAPALLTADAAPQRWDLFTLFIWLICGYLLLLPIGNIALYASSTLAAGNELTADRARFAVINALTLTGFQSGISIDTYPLPGQIVMLLLTLVGTAFSLIAGGLAVVRIARLPFSDVQVVRAGLTTCASLTILGALPLAESGSTLLSALMLSAGSLGNSGLYLVRLPAMTGWQTHLIILPLAVLGSLGLPVLMELYDLVLRRRPLSFYSRTVLWLAGLFYVGGFVWLLLLRWLSAPSLPSSAADTASFLASASVASINSRSLGLPFEYAQDFPRAMRWGVVLLMIVGGGPASAAGGLKMTTLCEIARGVRRILVGQQPSRAMGFAIAWVASYAGLVVLAFLALLLADPQLSTERVFYEVVSAVSNAGLSYDRIFTVSPGLDVLTAAMLLGRVVPLLILWWMAQKTVEPELPVA